MAVGRAQAIEITGRACATESGLFSGVGRNAIDVVTGLELK
jgi:hypothetical protein